MDLSRAFTIDVTADDIRAGVTGRSTACPIASAGTRMLPGGFTLIVGPREADIVRGQGLCPCGCGDDGPEIVSTRLLPSEAREFISAFDDGQDVDPFTFTLPEADL